MAVVEASHRTGSGTHAVLSERDQSDVITAYREVGTYRGAAQICGVDLKTVKRIVERSTGQAPTTGTSARVRIAAATRSRCRPYTRTSPSRAILREVRRRI
jgi:hypothetical protein